MNEALAERMKNARAYIAAQLELCGKQTAKPWFADHSTNVAQVKSTGWRVAEMHRGSGLQRDDDAHGIVASRNNRESELRALGRALGRALDALEAVIRPGSGALPYDLVVVTDALDEICTLLEVQG